MLVADLLQPDVLVWSIATPPMITSRRAPTASPVRIQAKPWFEYLDSVAVRYERLPFEMNFAIVDLGNLFATQEDAERELAVRALAR